ncbi:hypothetical protein [Rhizobium lusitanum]|nr:hypothetical protein [Rhizobium lusitanum]
MMSRFMHAGVPADPLQRPRAATLAASGWRISSQALLDGLHAVAPRLGLVFLIAGVLQMLLHWAGH